MASACTIPKLNTTRYSSPIPVIGLYIAAGSLVCFLLMLFDIISAYRRRQSWIPCRFFKLNSFTLTLLAIATKLQVDLTTPMPGVPDQLSKLTGTTMLCICMGFLNLSIGNNRDSEYLSNMASLSIMIITVVVNICIQLSTGVIHLFIAEHIIMMCCMLVVLLVMWHCAHETKFRNSSDIAYVKRPLKNLDEFKNLGLLWRLKACYAIGFDKNPQLRACRNKGNLILVSFCLACCCVLVEAIVRSVVVKQLGFCRGGSDYDWSTWFILITQNLTVLLGCFAIFFRWFTSFSFVSNESYYVDDDESMKEKFTAIFGSPSCYKLGIYSQTSVHIVVSFLSFLVLWLPILLFRVFGGKIHEEEDSSLFAQAFITGPLPVDDFSNYVYPCNCTMEKVRNDFDKCEEESKRDSPNQLLQLLSRIRPSPQLHNFAPSYDMASPLPLVALEKIAITCLPEAETTTLRLCFRKAIDILQTFIDPKDPHYALFMRNTSFIDEDFDRGHRYAIHKVSYLDNDTQQNKDYLDGISDYLSPITRITWTTSMALKVVKEIQNRWRDTRAEDLFGVIEQLFVDMLHSAFAELPNAIVKLVMECPMEEYKEKVFTKKEYKEKVRHVLVGLLKIAPLENNFKWTFPEKYGISSLILPPSQEVVATDDQNN